MQLHRRITVVLLGGIFISVGLNADAAAQLPDPGMDVDLEHTALVITDPQNDFLSPEGVMWGLVGESVTQNNTVEHIEDLFKVAKKKG